MGEIIRFEDIVRSRRRQRERESFQRCLEIIAINLEYIQILLAEAGDAERPVYLRRIEQLSALMEYGERLV